MRTVAAIRYVLPLREGGSLPAIIEADDGHLYVVKFRGAGQGPLALVAELLAGELARVLHLPVPELVFVTLDPAFGRSEPDPEIRHLLKGSTGLNLGLAYLPGATTFDIAANDTVTPELASRIVWLDAFVQNVDRTPRNPNLLVHQRTLHLIDHGAAFYFQHGDWQPDDRARAPFPLIAQHILLPWATALADASSWAQSKLSSQRFQEILTTIPDLWLLPQNRENAPPSTHGGVVQELLTNRTPNLSEATAPSAPLANPPAELPHEAGSTQAAEASAARQRYLTYCLDRLAAHTIFEEEAARAHHPLL